MNEEQYRRICKACDEILLSPGSNINTVNIPWLHVLNEHSANLKKYAELFEPEYSSQTPNYIHFISESVKALIGIMRSKIARRRISGKKSVLFISHLINEKQVGDPCDFYFGDLPADLIKAGVSNLMLLINHTQLDSDKLINSWDVSGGERAFFPAELTFMKELKIRISLFLESYRLFRKGKKEKEKFRRDVTFKAASETLSSSAITVLRFYYFIISVVKNTRAESIVVTFEGHSWERMVFAAAKKSKPGIRCIGYHHTILFPRQHAALRNLPKQFQPDVILTAGDHTKSFFRKSYPSSVAVSTLGMHRAKQNDSIQPEMFKKMDVPTCLVIPDGIVSEVLYIFRFVIAVAIAEPEIHFLLRLHPQVPQKDFFEEYKEFNHLPTNVSFSKNDIQSDFNRSIWALYRGSNAAIYATIAGLRPIYLSRENELGIDCLFELQTWKKVVSEIGEFINILKSDLCQKNPQERDAESKGAIEESKRYFMPVNNEVFFQSALKNA